jgi:DNA-nicking Smr family endonuclease
MRRRRTLSAEERQLWDAVAKTTRTSRKPQVPEVDPLAVAPFVLPPIPEPVMPFRLGERALSAAVNDLALPLSVALSRAPLQMDARTHARMTRGKLVPEARIDLHGMTLAEAHPELIRFVLNAHADAMRLVLVITGKGKDRDDGGPIPRRMGALRHQVPQWLRLLPLGPVVQQVAEAHARHGGHGALYVYLRRR